MYPLALRHINAAALGLVIVISPPLVFSFCPQQHPVTYYRRTERNLNTLTAVSVVDGSLSPPPILKEEDFDNVQQPRGAKNDWEVHKFGGASLATAELYRTVGDLLIRESEGRDGGGTIPTMAIVSARGGMTDLLVKVVDSALLNFDQANIALQEAVESQITLLKELAPPDVTDPIEASFRRDGHDILSVVQSLRMLNTVPAVTMEVVTGTVSLFLCVRVCVRWQVLLSVVQFSNFPLFFFHRIWRNLECPNTPCVSSNKECAM
jgi:hypothetical protein